MTRIGLLSDTHDYLDTEVFRHFESVDEVWHAGDFGDLALARALADFKPLVGVYGNIDGQDIRSRFPERQFWTCGEVPVFMIHIGGYPGRYAPGVRAEIIHRRPRLFICGHSHILKIQYDEATQCLHINPGAAGNQGWHHVRTLVRFEIDGERIGNCQVIELGPRSGQTTKNRLRPGQ